MGTGKLRIMIETWTMNEVSAHEVSGGDRAMFEIELEAICVTFSQGTDLHLVHVEKLWEAKVMN